MSVTVKWHGAKVKRNERKGAERGLQKAADHILEVSQQLVPVAPIAGGYLRDSGETSVDGLRAAVSYASGPADNRGRSGGGSIAAIVHENMRASHTTGQAKYLEQPFNTERRTALEIIAREIKGKIGA